MIDQRSGGSQAQRFQAAVRILSLLPLGSFGVLASVVWRLFPAASEEMGVGCGVAGGTGRGRAEGGVSPSGGAWSSGNRELGKWKLIILQIVGKDRRCSNINNSSRL